MAVKPITPKEAGTAFREALPDAVIEEWNAAISEAGSHDWDYRVIRQDDIAERLAKRMGVALEVVFAKRWLDVEPLYEAVGWTVVYDRPGFNETYPATFKFTPRTRTPRIRGLTAVEVSKRRT